MGAGRRTAGRNVENPWKGVIAKTKILISHNSASPPPRLAATFWDGENTLFYSTSGNCNVQYRAERITKRAQRYVENPWKELNDVAMMFSCKSSNYLAVTALSLTTRTLTACVHGRGIS
jgi:hypothetical protein